MKDENSLQIPAMIVAQEALLIALFTTHPDRPAVIREFQANSEQLIAGALQEAQSEKYLTALQVQLAELAAMLHDEHARLAEES